MEAKELTEDQVSNAVKTAITDAVEFIDSEIAPDRIVAQKYYDGKSRVDFEENRSQVVATKCRDTIRSVKPSLMRVFLQSGTPVEFAPRRAETVRDAEQATKFADFVFQQNDGFSVLSSVFHDALVKKVGVAKVYYDETETVEFDNYSNVTEEQITFIQQSEEAEIKSMEVTTEAVIDEMTGQVIQPALYDVEVILTSTDGNIKIDAIAPEDFFVDQDATSIKDCFVCGHSTEGRVGDLVEMGFDFDKVYSLSGTGETTTSEEEDIARKGHSNTNGEDNSIDPSMRRVLITEAYMKMDIDGVGIPKLYKFLCGGSDYEVLDYELCDYNPFAIFEVDPEPHTFFGKSLVDIIIDDQDASTSLIRGLLDNISMMNNPRLVVNENAVNLDDVLNNEIGGIIRAQDVNALRELMIGSAGSSALPAMSYYDEAIKVKTGVSGASMGMDTDTLTANTAAGVNAAVQAASAVSELIARTLAEGGMKQMFDIIAKLARQHPKEDQVISVDGQFVPVDPSSWGTEIDIVAKVGLGHNHHAERMQTLMQTSAFQQQVFQAYGPQNGIVTLTNIRNTLADIMKLGGIYDVERHIQPMTPEIEQQMLQQAQQAAQGQQQQSDPNQAFLQVEQMKAQTKAQTDAQKMALDNQQKTQKMAMEDDLKRDQMAQDLLVDTAKIVGQYGTTVDVARVKAEQAAPRPIQPNGVIPNGQ
jgi:hypothetical protein